MALSEVRLVGQPPLMEPVLRIRWGRAGAGGGREQGRGGGTEVLSGSGGIYWWGVKRAAWVDMEIPWVWRLGWIEVWELLG